MKFNNENAKEQMSYVAPKMKVFRIAPSELICNSPFQASELPDSEEEDWGKF